MAQSPVLTTQDLNVLATTVLSEVQSYLESLKSRGIDSPSLTCSQDIRLRSDAGQPEVESSKRAIVRACEKVIALTQGPSQWLWMETSGHITTAALSIVLALKVQHHVSSDPAKPTSLDQLSVATGGSRDLLRRVLRHLTQRFIFQEASPTHYIHNAASQGLTHPIAEASATIGSLDFYRASPALVDVLKGNDFQIPESSRTTAFSKAFGTDLNLFDYLREKDPELGKRFALSMSGRTSGPHHLYPYESLAAGAIIVDVAGGSGHVCVDLAHRHGHLRFIVQDYDDIVSYGRSSYASEKLPIEWHANNVFDPQPVKGADVYLVRHLLVDFPDAEAVQILKHVADAMSDTSRMLIAEGIMSEEFGEESNRTLNTIDLHLLCLFNSKERTVRQWKALVESVGKGLEVTNLWLGDGGADGQGMIEIMRKPKV